MDWVVCPDCAHPAEVTWRSTASGSVPGAEYAKVHCLRGHWFLLPGERLLAWPSTRAF